MTDKMEHNVTFGLLCHLGIVGVSVCLRELVVGPVVPGPGVDGVLPGHSVGQHQSQPQR